MFYVITNQGTLQPAPGMEWFWVLKCQPVPENGMNIDLDVVNNSDFDFRHKNSYLKPFYSNIQIGIDELIYAT